FIFLDQSEAIQLRKDILRGVVEAFKPDVIFVDHLPLGANEELADILESTRCIKYLVTRGVLNETENLRQLVLGGRAHNYLKLYYHKILVASDPKVFNFLRQYNVSSEIREKTIHTGYVIESMPQYMIKKTREGRGLNNGDVWVVASAGSGQRGEPLIEGCLELARTHKDIVFDVVLGPKSSLAWPDRHLTSIARDNLHLHKEVYQMPYFHASADLVISTGGYNSLLETLQGNAKILCFPYRKDQRDEQYHHAVRLKKFIDIKVSTDLCELPEIFERAIRSIRSHEQHDQRRDLDFNGAAVIEKIVFDDLGLVDSAVYAGGAPEEQ